MIDFFYSKWAIHGPICHLPIFEENLQERQHNFTTK